MADLPYVYDIRSLQVTRQKGGARFQLQIPEMRISRGEALAIVGASGCGKSTLLDMLGLVLPPTECESFRFQSGSGKVVDLVRRSGAGMLADIRRQEIGYVLQHGALLPFLTARDNALLPQHLSGIRDPATVDHLFERLGIADQARKLPQFLSGGQRQRAAIARAMAIQPPVILCDEPTAAVDEINAKEIIHQLKALCRTAGSTLIVVTHNIDLLREHVDRWFTFTVERPAAQTIVSVCHECPPP